MKKHICFSFNSSKMTQTFNDLKKLPSVQVTYHLTMSDRSYFKRHSSDLTKTFLNSEIR